MKKIHNNSKGIAPMLKFRRKHKRLFNLRVVEQINKKYMQFLVTISLMVHLISCAVDKSTELNFLVGTWKRENKELYEVWEQNKTNELKGYSYTINGDQKSITETLIIRRINDQIVYEATVPDQNDGRTIQFKLNIEIDSFFSFENYNHDFPKKIQYRKIDDNQIKVNVLGDNGNGFSYIQKRQ